MGEKEKNYIAKDLVERIFEPILIDLSYELIVNDSFEFVFEKWSEKIRVISRLSIDETKTLNRHDDMTKRKEIMFSTGHRTRLENALNSLKSLRKNIDDLCRQIGMERRFAKRHHIHFDHMAQNLTK